MKEKISREVWVKFWLLALLLVNSGVTLTACQNVRFGPDSAKKVKEDKAVKTNKKKSPANQSTKSQPNSQATPGEAQDTQIDDDPQ